MLIVKVNKIYSGKDVNGYVAKYAGDLYDNIFYVDEELSDDKMQGLIASADCYVAPSRCEGFNIILLEAMCLGVPCIASKNSGHLDFCNSDNCLFVETEHETYPEFVPPYEESKWFEPNFEQLKQCMKDVIDTPDRMKEITKEAMRLKEEYNWKNIVDKLEEVFKKV